MIEAPGRSWKSHQVRGGVAVIRDATAPPGVHLPVSTSRSSACCAANARHLPVQAAAAARGRPAWRLPQRKAGQTVGLGRLTPCTPSEVTALGWASRQPTARLRAGCRLLMALGFGRGLDSSEIIPPIQPKKAPPLAASRPFRHSGDTTFVATPEVGEEGFEPSRPCGHTDLNRARLPFRHPPGRLERLARTRRWGGTRRPRPNHGTDTIVYQW